jgi:hypothetical protein
VCCSDSTVFFRIWFGSFVIALLGLATLNVR